MLNEKGLQIRPPEGDELKTVLGRIKAHIEDRVDSARSKRTRRVRVIGAAALGVILFGGGLALGGAAIEPLTEPSPAFTVACYPTLDATKTTMQLSYTSESDAVLARHNPVDACAQTQTVGGLEDGVDTVVRQEIAAGYQCGTLHLSDGSTWSYLNDPKNGLTVESATPTTPLGQDCVVLNNLTITEPTPAPAFACTIDSTHVSVYPGNPEEANSACSAKGLTVAGQ